MRDITPPELKNLHEIEYSFPQIRELYREDGLVIREHIVGAPSPRFDEPDPDYKYNVSDVEVVLPNGQVFSFAGEFTHGEKIEFQCMEYGGKSVNEKLHPWTEQNDTQGNFSNIRYNWEEIGLSGSNLAMMHEIGHNNMRWENPELFQKQQQVNLGKIAGAEKEKIISLYEQWCWNYAKRRIIELRSQGIDLEPEIKLDENFAAAQYKLSHKETAWKT